MSGRLPGAHTRELVGFCPIVNQLDGLPDSRSTCNVEQPDDPAVGAVPDANRLGRRRQRYAALLPLQVRRRPRRQFDVAVLAATDDESMRARALLAYVLRLCD